MTRPNRRELLLWGGAALATAAVPWRRRRAHATVSATPRNLVIVFAGGGWDTTYALDPKAPGFIDVPAGTVQTFEQLDILVDPSRPAVAGFFERHAAISAVVRGVVVSSIAHPECTKRILTGTRSETNPDIGAIVAHQLGRDLPLPYLVLGDTAFSGPLASSTGRVGATNQVVALLDPDAAYPVVGAPSPAYVPGVADEAAIRAYTRARAERERAVRGATGYNARRVDDFIASLDRGDLLRELRAGFGGRGRILDLASQSRLAIDAIAGGISHAVMLSARAGWDTHNDNADQTGNHQLLFTGLTALAEDLAARPGKLAGHSMLDETVVAVLSEMGRTPRLNGDGGKDHWPVTSALVFGGGVAGGRAYGGTTNRLEASEVDFATGEVSAEGRALEARSLAAGLLALCGVDPAPHLDAEVFDAIVA